MYILRVYKHVLERNHKWNRQYDIIQGYVKWHYMIVMKPWQTMKPKETGKSLPEVSVEPFSKISESGIPYFNYCRNTTEMGVRKPKRRWLVRRMKDCWGMQVKETGVNKDWKIREPNSEEINGKETFILCGFWIPKYAWKKSI